MSRYKMFLASPGHTKSNLCLRVGGVKKCRPTRVRLQRQICIGYGQAHDQSDDRRLYKQIQWIVQVHRLVGRHLIRKRVPLHCRQWHVR